MPPEDRHSGVPGGGGSGADVKSGTVSVGDGGSVAVTFGTAFASSPEVVVGFGDDNQAVDSPRAKFISTTGFTATVYKGHGGSAHSWTVKWIATDAGDP